MTRAKASILLGACLAACSQRAPPRAEYADFCKREFKIAKEVARETRNRIQDESGWISKDDYRARFGAPPVSVVYRFAPNGTETRLEVPALSPDVLNDLSSTDTRLASMERVLGTPQSNIDQVIQNPLETLENSDRLNARKSMLVAKGATAKDLLPKLDECYRRLR